MKKFLLFILTIAIIASTCIVASFAEEEGEEIPFQTSVDYIAIDGKGTATGGGHGGTSLFSFADEEYIIAEKISFGGWCAVEGGIEKYQYSVNGEAYVDMEGVEFQARPDLANAGIPYVSGHDTAGFQISTFVIPASAIPYPHSYVTIRVITTEGNYADIFEIVDISVEGQTPTPTQEPTPTPEATATPDTTATPEVTKAPATDAPAADTEAPAEGGCGSVIGGSITILAVMSAAALVLKKKESK